MRNRKKCYKVNQSRNWKQLLILVLESWIKNGWMCAAMLACKEFERAVVTKVKREE